MLSLRCHQPPKWAAIFVLACIVLCAGSSQLFAEETATGDADDQPVAATIPDEKKANAEPVLLRYRFHPNQFLHYEVVHEMIISLSAKDLTETTKNKSVSKQHLRVVSVNNDAATIEATIDHVWMKSQFDDNPPTVFDSANRAKQPPQFAKVLESIGKPQGRQRVDARGNIIPDDKTSAAMAKASPLIPFPEHAVAVGATWNEDYAINVRKQKLERPIKMRRKYTLTQLDGQFATIEFKTLELDNPQDPEIRAQLIQMTPSGSIQFDIKEGKIVAKTIHSDKVEYEIAGGAMRVVSDHKEKLFTPKK